ncbi:MAG TPA: translation initiation factor IF-3 [Candidatus Kapabacteria bacterium]|nr:translation initiation factor IF-3 [Candidatus Kapabacteria bacterium]
MDNLPKLNLKKANKPAVPREESADGSASTPDVTSSSDSSASAAAPAAPAPQSIGGFTLKKRAPGEAPAARPSGPGGPPSGLRTGGGGGFQGGGFAPRPAPTNNRMNRFSREMPSRDPGVRMNENIRVPEIRVIDDEGQVGVMSPREALEIARERGLDLIEIVPNAQPPVCKIIDFGKWKYEQQKRDKAQKKTQHQQLLKEVRFHPSTDTHDFEFKTRHARDFLLEGHKVKATVQFKGREVTYRQFGEGLLTKFLERLADISKIDQQISMMGKQMTVVISPTAKKKKDEPKKDTGPRMEKARKAKAAEDAESEVELVEVEMEAGSIDDSGLSERDLEALLLADPTGASSDDDDETGEMEVADADLPGVEVSEEEIIDHADLDVGEKPKDDEESKV